MSAVRIFHGMDVAASPGKPRVEPHPKDEKSLTRQSEKDSCDVNKIIKKFESTGILPPASGDGQWLDVSGMPDFRGALDYVREAETQFMQLPAEVRREFDNDPAKLLDFISDAANRDKAIELGLIPAPEVPRGPVEVKVVSDVKE